MHILVIIILIVILVLVILVSIKKTEETHIHPKAHFDQRKNTVTLSSAPYVKMYKIFKSVIVTDENSDVVWNRTTNEGSGPDFALKLLAVQPHDGTAGSITINLPSSEIMEPHQVQIHALTTTGTTEVHAPITFETMNQRTYNVTITQDCDPNISGVTCPPLPQNSSVVPASLIITDIGHIYFQPKKGSLITISDVNPPNALNSLALQAYFGANAGVPSPSINTYSSYRPIALYGNQRGCSFGDSKNFCGINQSLQPPDLCTSICDRGKTNNQTDTEFLHGNFFYFGNSGQTATFTFTITDPTITDICGTACP